MRDFFPLLAGNDTLRHRLGEEFSAGSFSHAYIIEGAAGSGKRTLALQLAMAAACEHRLDAANPLPCGTCRSCRKIKEGLCPDVITVKRPEDKATMGVDVVRGIRESVAVVPNDLDVKVYIVEDAHTLTQQAQNALLLTLEEPPMFVLFLLLVEDAGLLLETVRSRAPIFRMQPLARPVLEAQLALIPEARALKSSSPAEYEEVLLLSAGRMGTALALLDAKTRAPLLERRRFAAELIALLADKKSADLLLLLQARGSRRDELIADLSEAELALRDLTLLSYSERSPLLFFTDRETAADLSARFTAARLLTLSAALQETKSALAANANVKLTVTRLVRRLTL